MKKRWIITITDCVVYCLFFGFLFDKYLYKREWDWQLYLSIGLTFGVWFNLIAFRDYFKKKPFYYVFGISTLVMGVLFGIFLTVIRLLFAGRVFLLP